MSWYDKYINNDAKNAGYYMDDSYYQDAYKEIVVEPAIIDTGDDEYGGQLREVCKTVG